MLGGVANGLGSYFGIDPLLFRILFVVLTAAGGIGVLLYAALWILVPPATGGDSVGQTALRRPGGRAWLGAALLGVAALLLADAVGFQRPGVIWALALIALGVLLFRQDAGSGPPPGGPSEPAGPDQLGRAGTAGGPPAAWASAPPPGSGWSGGTTSAAWGSPPPPRPHPSPATWGAPPPGGWGYQPRSVLGLVTFAVAVLAVGVATLLDNLGVVELTIGRALALFLVVIGLGLVAGGWRGSSAGLVVLGLLLVPAVAAASLADVPFRGGVGELQFQPRSLAEIRSNYQLAVGRLVVDLSEVRFGKDPTRVRATVAAGELLVYVPSGVPVEVRGRASAGQVNLFDHVDDGIQIEAGRTVDGSEGIGRLTLDLSAGYGTVRVLRGPPPYTGPSEFPEPRPYGMVIG